MEAHATSSADVERLLARASRARVAVVGDFCLDAYWEIDCGEPELSIETGLPTRRVRAQRYSPGGAGNVAMNLAALGVERVSAIGLVGSDPFGACMLGLLRAAGVDCRGVLDGPANWQTPVYAKPITDGEEGGRTDFGAFNAMDAATARRLAAALDEAASTHDALIVNRQLPNALATGPFVDAINSVAAAHPDLLVLVDARYGACDFAGAVLKLNRDEAVRLALAGDAGADAKAAAETGDTVKLASAIQRKTGRAVFITRGARGLVAAAHDGAADISGIPVPSPIDTVGAGDCLASALAATLCAGARDGIAHAAEAAAFANLAASVILKKLHTTGTASPAEIRAAARRLGNLE